MYASVSHRFEAKALIGENITELNIISADGSCVSWRENYVVLYKPCNKMDRRNQRFIVITLYDFSKARNVVSGWDPNEQNGTS